MHLRPYQQDLTNSIYSAWGAGVRNVLAVCPTGGGKTVIFSNIIRANKGPSVAIAHRQELVTQISLALARNEVRHRIIGPPAVVRLCSQVHCAEVGASWVDPSAMCAVAGVDTLGKRTGVLRQWAESCTLWVQDEAHHLLPDNKWGKAIAMFPNARGLGVTATPERADGRGLDGIFQRLVSGPTMRELINNRPQYLTEYRIFAPRTSDLNLQAIDVSKATGDYNPVQLKLAVRKSHVVGDVVDHYLRIARGKLGVTFATDVETATDIAAQFNAQGIPAAMVCAETPDRERIDSLRKFKRRELLQLVNVDLFGEGFDLPAIEVCSMARPTQSYPLYVQQFGRALRILDGKQVAIIIDHVGNVLRHGLPDADRVFSLSAREKKSHSTEGEKLRTCPSCTGVYERILGPACPYCGHAAKPAARSGPEFVDGDLLELDEATLARMRGAVSKVDMDTDEYARIMRMQGVPYVGVLANAKRHRDTKRAQEILRDAIAWWAGYHGMDYRRFYLTFGVDVLSAQALGAREAGELCVKIWGDIENKC